MEVARASEELCELSSGLPPRAHNQIPAATNNQIPAAIETDSNVRVLLVCDVTVRSDGWTDKVGCAGGV